MRKNKAIISHYVLKNNLLLGSAVGLAYKANRTFSAAVYGRNLALC
jgi:hypothetical protein